MDKGILTAMIFYRHRHICKLDEGQMSGGELVQNKIVYFLRRHFRLSRKQQYRRHVERIFKNYILEMGCDLFYWDILQAYTGSNGRLCLPV